MPREKLIRDPIHDLISLDLDNPTEQLLFNLIDTREYQRLRRIRQMGMAGYVFPGAEHSRFTHSIGVMYLMRQVVDRLDDDNKLDPILRTAAFAAALLHDVGHGPFSHVMEKFFGYRHEQWSKKIICSEHTEVNKLLRDFDPDLPQLVVSIIDHKVDPKWISYILSSQMDVDRFDYLSRDSHMTGVKYGIFDLDRLMLMLRIDADSGLVYVARKGLLPVEKYLQSRYHMYRQVYFHKACAAAESMLMATLKRCQFCYQNIPSFQDHLPAQMNQFFSNKEQMTVSDYLDLDDSIILYCFHLWEKSEDKILSDLASRLLNRRLYKSIEVSELDENDLEFRQRLSEAANMMRKNGLDPDYCLLFGSSSDTPYLPYWKSRSKGNFDQRIWMEGEKGSSDLQEISECSPTIRAFTDSPYSLNRIYYPDLGEKRWRENITKLFLD